MIRTACAFFLAATGMLAQSSDPQTLQALLQEVRQLREDVRAMTLVGQRVQILLYRVQLQDDATKKAAQRHDQANEELRAAERNRLEGANRLKAAEEKLAALRDQSHREAIEDEVREMKHRFEVWSRDETTYRDAEIAADNELKAEQAKLVDLQQRLDRLERQLESYAPAPGK
jgi:chromosome segregation ATPase